MAQSNTKSIRTFEEFLVVTREGTIVVDGNRNPSDAEIAQAVRKFAQQYATSKSNGKDEYFTLKNAHPRIADPGGTRMTREQWMEKYPWLRDDFDHMHTTAVFIKR